jgi:uncharacterized protein
MTQVRISDIPAEGLQVQCTEDPAELEVTAPGTRFLEAVAVDVWLAKAGNAITATGQIAAPVAFECARCLREFPSMLDIPIQAQFLPPPPPLTPGEHRMPTEEAENYYYRDEALVLDDLVRQEILLAVPINPQCRTDCRGLCVQCGQDLNVGTCACPPPRDPRLVALQNFLKKT